MKLKEELIVEFLITSSELHYDKISEILWIACDEFCEKWWKINNKDIWYISDKYLWIKKSWVSKFEEDLDIHLEAIFTTINELKDKLLQLKKDKCTFQFNLIWYTNHYNPPIYIEEKYLKLIWEIWMSLNIDVYCL